MKLGTIIGMVASKCENMTEGYRKWREWFEPLMLEIVKRKKNVKTEGDEPSLKIKGGE